MAAEAAIYSFVLANYLHSIRVINSIADLSELDPAALKSSGVCMQGSMQQFQGVM
jgi:hypothetical protein